jgi:hypothetical protein
MKPTEDNNTFNLVYDEGKKKRSPKKKNGTAGKK